MNNRKYSNYYDYVKNVVENCSCKWIIMDRKDFRDYRIDDFNEIPGAEMPKGELIKIIPAKCKSYSCPTCGRKKVYDLMDRLRAVDLKGYRFFTLTLRNEYSETNTIKNLKRIAECFNKLNKMLRKDKRFKTLEYFRVLEVGNDGMVHVHGIWNKYIPTRELGMMWYKITKDSFIVRPERIKSQSDAVRYLYKYLSKNIADDSQTTDPNLFGLDLINTAKLFYENGKRRYQASRKFFPKAVKKVSKFLPYWFEASTENEIENSLKNLINNYKLKRENFNFSLYDASDQFLHILFDTS